MSSDSLTFEMDHEAAKLSEVLGNILKNSSGVELIEQEVPVPGRVLQKIVDWCVYHRNDVPAAEDPDEYFKSVSSVVSDWDLAFLDVDPGLFFDLVNVANYLKITGLKHVCCKRMAQRMENRTDDEIRSVFQIPNEN